MARVLVTGASGMLGAATARALAARGDEVTVLQRSDSPDGLVHVRGDVADPDVAARAVRGQDAVVHLAARVGVVGSLEDFRRTNVEGTRGLLDAARAAGVTRFVHVSSPSVAHVGTSLHGEGATPADPDAAQGAYARTKARAEQLALAADGPDLAVAVVRPHLVWGPGDTQLVGRILTRARQGRLPLLGSGAALVDTTFVDNAVDALVAALDRAEVCHGEPLVVTNGEPRPIGDLIASMCRAGGVRVPTRRIPAGVAYGAGAMVEAAMRLADRVPGVPAITEPPLTRFLAEQLSTAHWFDQRRTRDLLAWAPAIDLDEGFVRLARTLRPDGGST